MHCVKGSGLPLCFILNHNHYILSVVSQGFKEQTRLYRFKKPSCFVCNISIFIRAAFHIGHSVRHSIGTESFFSCGIVLSEKGGTPIITSKQLERMSLQPIQMLEKETLADISAIKIRKDLSPEKALLTFLEQIGNPYCFRCGDLPVRARFSDNGPALEEVLQNFFIRMKQG